MQEKARRKGDAALVAALASGSTVRDAARTAGVNEATAHRRLKDRDFRLEVNEARAALMAAALGRLADAGTEATETLRALLGADAENVRLGAARSILELGAKLREAVELEERLATVERELAVTEAVKEIDRAGQ